MDRIESCTDVESGRRRGNSQAYDDEARAKPWALARELTGTR